MTTSGRELRGRCLNVRRGEKGRGVGYNIFDLKIVRYSIWIPNATKIYLRKKKTVLHPPKNKQTKRVRCREKISLYTVRFASTSSLFAFISSKSWSKISIWSLRSRKRPVFWAIVGSYESLKNRTTHKDYLTVRRCNDSCKVVSAKPQFSWNIFAVFLVAMRPF